MPSPPPCAVCGRPSTKRCPHCRAVSYCGEQHRSEDSETHKPECRACKVYSSRRYGSFLKSTRDINEGEVIFTEYPVIIGPSHFSQSLCCVGCFRGLPSREDTLPKCPECQWATCSQSCPGLSDPDGHAVECALMKLVVDKSCPRQLLLSFRCMLLQIRKPRMWDWLLDLTPTAINKQADPSKHQSAGSVLENIAETILQGDPRFLALDYSAETFENILTVLDSYGLSFFSSCRKSDLTALYKTAGFLRLNCVANTRTDFKDIPETNSQKNLGRVVVSAIKNIRKGKKLTYSYAMPMASTSSRQKKLALMNFFCRCRRCMDPRELGCDSGTMKCNSCPGWILPLETKHILRCNWACDRNCGEFRTANEVTTRFNYFSQQCKEIMKPGAIVSIRPETMEKMLTEFLAELHPNHELCLLLKSLLVKTYCIYNMNAGRRRLPVKFLERRAEICREMVDAVERFGENIYGVEMAVVCTIKDFVDTEFELTHRKYPSVTLRTDQATRNVVHYLMLLVRAHKILRMNPTEAHSGDIALLRGTYSKILQWAIDSGLPLPEDVNPVMV